MEDNKKKWDFEDEKTSEKTDISQKKETSIEPEHVEEIITGQVNKNVVLFIGPRQIGKTVALIRLTHYLNKNKKTNIKPNKLLGKIKDILNQ